MTTPKPAFPVNDVRGLFPQLSVPVNGVPLVYLDSAATSLKLGIALNRELDFSSHEMAAVNRGAHTLAAEATEKFDEARATVAHFVGARPANIVWTSNATAAMFMYPGSSQRRSKAKERTSTRRVSKHHHVRRG